jgi:hypothetical protein
VNSIKQKPTSSLEEENNETVLISNINTSNNQTTATTSTSYLLNSSNPQINNKSIQPKVDLIETKQNSKTLLGHTILIDMETYKGVVSFATSPLIFYIQLDEDQKHLNRLALNLNEYYRKSDNRQKEIINEYLPNMLCAGIYSVDKLWYRIRLLTVNKQSSFIFYSLILLLYS